METKRRREETQWRGAHVNLRVGNGWEGKKALGDNEVERVREMRQGSAAREPASEPAKQVREVHLVKEAAGGPFSQRLEGHQLATAAIRFSPPLPTKPTGNLKTRAPGGRDIHHQQIA